MGGQGPETWWSDLARRSWQADAACWSGLGVMPDGGKTKALGTASRRRRRLPGDTLSNGRPGRVLMATRRRLTGAEVNFSSGPRRVASAVPGGTESAARYLEGRVGGTRADAELGPPPAARARLRVRSARRLVAAVSLAGKGAAPLVCRWHAAPQMHAPAPRNARACTAPTSVSPAVGR